MRQASGRESNLLSHVLQTGSRMGFKYQSDELRVNPSPPTPLLRRERGENTSRRSDDQRTSLSIHLACLLFHHKRLPSWRELHPHVLTNTSAMYSNRSVGMCSHYFRPSLQEGEEWQRSTKGCPELTCSAAELQPPCFQMRETGGIRTHDTEVISLYSKRAVDPCAQ